MTASRDPDRLIRAFLREGEEELHYQVYDAVRAEIERKRQRAVFGPWRTPIMNRSVLIGLGAAAVVVVALLVGSRLFGSPGAPSNVGAGGEPTPTPQPSVAQPSTPADGSLPEGPFVLSEDQFDDGAPGVPITVTIPGPGWYGEPGGGIIENSGATNFGPDDAGMIGPFVGEIYVPADPCEWSTTMPDTPATTVDEVVAALQAQASRDASEPVDITVDGHSGKSITLHVPDDAVFGECERTAAETQARFCTLTVDDPAVCHRYHQFPGQTDEVWVLDVNGEVVVIDASWGDETPAEDIADLRSILESMNFE